VTADADPETAPSVIQSAGIVVKQTPVRAKRVFAAKFGPVSGSVHLVTEAAARRASYLHDPDDGEDQRPDQPTSSRRWVFPAPSGSGET
jgi:hypothetical protein